MRLTSLQDPLVATGLASSLLTSLTTPHILTSSGLTYEGIRDATSGQDSFLGIRFAEPPIGSLRFKPPVRWTPGNINTIDASRYGDSCIQIVPFTSNTVSEDCLTLNIRKPTDTEGKLPVMVWIYGGGFYAGDSSHYAGDALLERAMKINKPIVFVSLNYRLGVYGFPPGQAAGESGAMNLGLKDQRLALEWIQENIEYFGGDPTKVVIFGESAGAMSAFYQSFYRGGRVGGAFRGMILQSGALDSARILKSDDPVREAGFQYIANATGCADATNQFECVRRIPESVLTQASKDVLGVPPKYRFRSPGAWLYGPSYGHGDDFFPSHASRLMHEGKYTKVPFISGAQLDEGTVFVDGPDISLKTDRDVIDLLTARLPGLYYGMSNATLIKDLLKYYPNDPVVGSPYGTGNETFGRYPQYKRLASLVGDLIFQAPRRAHLRMSTRHGVDAWSYILKQQPVVRPVPAHGVFHGGDVDFVMQTIKRVDPNVSGPAVELQETIGDYWVNFAYNLNPNSEESTLLRWPRYGHNEEALQLLASDVVVFQDNQRGKAIDHIINSPELFDRP